MERYYVTVTLCICLSAREHISETTCPTVTRLSTYAAGGRGTVLLCRRSDVLYTSNVEYGKVIQGQ